MKSILDGVTLGAAHHAEVHDPTMVEGNQHLEQEVHVATGHPLVEMHVIDWAEAQRENPTFSTVLDLLKVQKQTDLKVPLTEHASSEKGKLVLCNQQNFGIHWGPCTYVQCLKVKLKSCCHPEWVPLRCGLSRE